MTRYLLAFPIALILIKIKLYFFQDSTAFRPNVRCCQYLYVTSCTLFCSCFVVVGSPHDFHVFFSAMF